LFDDFNGEEDESDEGKSFVGVDEDEKFVGKIP